VKLVVATDIFGITTELVNWLQPIVETLQLEVVMVSPYAEDFLPVEAGMLDAVAPRADDHAYQSFLKHGGLDFYTQKLQHCAESQPQAFMALGFSAGAAALWQVSASSSSLFKQAVCFYGGQIRFSSDLQPKVPTTLIWAQESHFDVEALHLKLSQYPTVNSILTMYAHGFVNPHSTGFHQEAARQFQHRLIQMLMLGSESVVNKTDGFEQNLGKLIIRTKGSE
jgi:hypothetical protein